jgi:hypothetical protein
MSDFYVRERKGKFQVCLDTEVANVVGESHTVAHVMSEHDTREAAEQEALDAEQSELSMGMDEDSDDGPYWTSEEWEEDYNSFDYDD